MFLPPPPITRPPPSPLPTPPDPPWSAGAAHPQADRATLFGAASGAAWTDSLDQQLVHSRVFGVALGVVALLCLCCVSVHCARARVRWRSAEPAPTFQEPGRRKQGRVSRRREGLASKDSAAAQHSSAQPEAQIEGLQMEVTQKVERSPREEQEGLVTEK